LTLTLLAGQSAWCQTTVGSITEITGTATLERGGRRLNARLGLAVQIDDKVASGPDGKLTVNLNDGSQLIIAESTSIVIRGSTVAGTTLPTPIQLLGGHLRSVVETSLGGVGTHFEVHTPNASSAVRGTDFETAYIEGKPCPGFPDCLRYTDVGVYKGTVEVTNPAAPRASVVVTEGYETTVPCDLAPSGPAPLGFGNLIGPGYR